MLVDKTYLDCKAADLTALLLNLENIVGWWINLKIALGLSTVQCASLKVVFFGFFSSTFFPVSTSNLIGLELIRNWQ